MSKTLIIAEAGVNHNGSLDRALELVDVAKEAGADVVKFQTFKAEQMISRRAVKAAYQIKNTGTNESQLEMVKRHELSEEAHERLAERCRQKGIEFLSTAFDFPSAELLLTKFNMRRLKIPSGEITNAPLLLKLAQSCKPLILSTGMCTLDDVRQALGVVAFGASLSKETPSVSAFAKAFEDKRNQQWLKENVVILHCTTEYPTPFSDVNLNAMATLRNEFGLPVGLSDHTAGYAAAVGAVALGATMIEKHFTLDRNLPGPDHKASLEPNELKAMITAIRQVEESLGSSEKKPAPSEQKNIAVARKSLVAAGDIRKGEIFTEENLTAKRPGSGISPMNYWHYLGQPARRDFEADEAID